MSTELNICGMTCGHFRAAMTNALKYVPGVENAQINPQALFAAVTDEGYVAQIR